MNTKILIVDDDREIVELLNIYLQNEGYEVLKAYNGQQALNILEEETYLNMVLLDIMIPQVDGLKVLSYIRKKPKELACYYGKC